MTERRITQKIPLIVILGPTASGKSDLAVSLAKALNGEIISADSRQIYKDLDIGTGKITKQKMKGVPHHLLDAVSLKRNFSVAEYEKRARKKIEAIIKKKKIPFLVGGSGMYIDAVLYGAPYPEVPPNAALRTHLEKKSTEELFSVLEKKDPRRARTIDRHNKRRLIRALEIITTTKRPIPELKKVPRYNALMLGIKKSEQELKKRIDARLTARLTHGMVKEVRTLLQKGVSHARLTKLGLEYRFLSKYTQGLLTRDKMKEQLFRAINQYAKRQMTWFRQYPAIVWVKNRNDAMKKIKAFITIQAAGKSS
ncbi:MAG: tRNA (adenosine(37)-N6)-dimethylallyltransferase MiaA [Patescibacteria group bacterium]